MSETGLLRQREVTRLLSSRCELLCARARMIECEVVGWRSRAAACTAAAPLLPAGRVSEMTALLWIAHRGGRPRRDSSATAAVCGAAHAPPRCCTDRRVARCARSEHAA